ncbi:MAG: hypothetical protein QOG68_128 [Solirubrobacteraceae bacterium]|nr:hypothetical protein [Solirubrobacteraceae bacterium]
MNLPPMLRRMRSPVRQLLTPAAAGLLGAALLALPSALASHAPAAHPVAASAAAKQPRCFGAASRDPEHPCRNPALRYKVIPTPDDALISPNAPCDPDYQATPHTCAFGLAENKAKGTVLLIGDSHAVHWRGALIVVATAYHWRGLSMTRTGCTFSQAEPVLPGNLKQQCIDWRKQVYAWLTAHPEVRTIFISQHPGNVVVPPGKTERQTKLEGFRDAFRALPDTVRHVVVIRDTPYVGVKNFDCVRHAITNHKDAGRVCAIPASHAIKVDDAADAVARYPMPGLKVADLNKYQCDASLCYPVVGGALTHKDTGHITAVFSTTLGPYLLRTVRSFGIRI